MTDIVKVTPEMVENEIVSEHYFTAADGVAGAKMVTDYCNDSNDAEVLGNAINAHDEASVPLTILTICVLQVKNGFTFVGTSSPVDWHAYDAELGRKYAREDAIDKLYPMLGFRLADENKIDQESI